MNTTTSTTLATKRQTQFIDYDHDDDDDRINVNSMALGRKADSLTRLTVCYLYLKAFHALRMLHSQQCTKVRVSVVVDAGRF